MFAASACGRDRATLSRRCSSSKATTWNAILTARVCSLSGVHVAPTWASRNRRSIGSVQSNSKPSMRHSLQQRRSVHAEHRGNLLELRQRGAGLAPALQLRDITLSHTDTLGQLLLRHVLCL